MTNPFLKILPFTLGLILLMGCGDNRKNSDGQNSHDTSTSENIFDKGRILSEKERWKEDLLGSGVLGHPCDSDHFSPETAQIWAKNNPDQLDGFPADLKKVESAQKDFDKDEQPDLLLYFNSENCTGHNGGTPSFAKIIYANGSTDDKVEEKIIHAIIKAYKEKRDSDPKWKAITDNYLKNTVSIAFEQNEIRGSFNLYSEEDAHCCPSYTGHYTYSPQKEKAEIELNETEK